MALSCRGVLDRLAAPRLAATVAPAQPLNERVATLQAKGETAMALKFVVGLFESRGTAEDACNRLRTEGVPAQDVSLLQLRETAPLPAVVEPVVESLSVDPLVVGNVRETFAPFIRNGETAVFVRTHSEDAVDLAVDTIRQYAPMRIKVVSAGEGAPIGHDVL
jgi:hypothetical protein